LSEGLFWCESTSGQFQKSPIILLIPLMTVKIKTFNHNYVATNTKGEREYFNTNKFGTYVLTIDEKAPKEHHCNKNVAAV